MRGSLLENIKNNKLIHNNNNNNNYDNSNDK